MITNMRSVLVSFLEFLVFDEVGHAGVLLLFMDHVFVLLGQLALLKLSKLLG